MAINVISSTPGHFGLLLNATSVDVSGCETILAAQGTGTRIAIDRLMINSTDAIAITVGSGFNAGSVGAPIIGPVEFSAALTLWWDFSGRGG